MKTASIALTCAALALLCPAIARTPAQPSSSATHAFGLWQAPLDQELPGVILTLADNSGRVIGAIVINAVSPHDGRLRVSRHSHAIMNLRVNGYTLRFVFIRRAEGLNRQRPSA